MAVPEFNYPLEMNYQKARLSTFVSLPLNIPVSALQLCEIGFYYDINDDGMKCYSCRLKIKLKDWPLNTDPLTIHLHYAPNCPYITNNVIDNIPLAYDKPQPFSTVHQLKKLNHPDQLSSNHSQIKLKYQTDTSEVDASPEAIANHRSFASDQSSNVLSDQLENGKARDTVANSTTNVVKHKKESRSRNDGRKTHTSSDAGSHISSTPVHGNLANAAPPQNFASTVPSETRENVTSNTSSDQKDLRYERGRLQSFRNWPSNAAVRPEVLAKSGFYYTGTDDRVQCTFCRGILRNWEAGDQPDSEHRRHFGQCPFLNNPFSVGNVTLEDEHKNPNAVDKRDLSQQDYCQSIITEKPVHQRYSLPADRLTTFRDFPTNMVQTPEMFARAGFFYSGIADNVKCFFCDGGLRNWEPNDDPWTEHARWFPRCGYLRLCKGDEFIKEVQDRYSPSLQYKLRPRTLKHKQPVDPRKLLKNMRSKLVSSVIEMGCDEHKVKEVVVRRMQELGDDFFPNTESLFDAISEYEQELKYIEEHGEADNNNDDDSNSNEELSVTTTQENDANKETEQTSETKKNKRKRKKKKKTSDKTNNIDNTLECLSQEDAQRLEDDVQKLKDERTCKVCMDEEVNVVFLKCGHLVCCSNCAPAMRHCPICREQIRGTVRVFLS